MFTTSKNIFKLNKAQAVTVIKAKETKVRPRLNGSERLKEGGFIVGLLVAILMMVALFSFNPADPSWSQTAWGGPVHNAGGYIGAWLADTLFFTFGSFAYPLPFIILGASWAFFRSRDEDESIDLLLWGTRLLGLTIMLLTSCGLADINFDDIWYFSSGGIVGDVLTSLSMPALNNLGSTLVFMFLWGAGFTLLTGISWLSIVENLGQWSLRACQRIFNRSRGEQTQVLSSAGFQQQELASLQFDDVEEKDLSLSLDAVDDSSEEIEAAQEPEKKAPRFNIHFPRKAKKTTHQEPVMSSNESIQPSEEDLNDPLFSAPATATPISSHSASPITDPQPVTQMLTTSSEHSANITQTADVISQSEQPAAPVAQETQDRYQNLNATIAELDHDAELHGDFASQQSENENNVSPDPQANQQVSVAPSTFNIDPVDDITPSLGNIDIAVEPESPIVVNTDLVEDDSQPLVAANTAQAVTQTNENHNSENQAIVQPNIEPQAPSTNEPVTQSEAEAAPSVTASHSQNRIPAATQEQSVHSEAVAVESATATEQVSTAAIDTDTAVHTDADSAAFQNMVATAQAQQMASQNPFLIQSDHNLPVPTAPMPTLELLYHPEKRENHIDRDALEGIARLVESKLADYKIEARVVDIFPGPVITRFELDLAPGVKVSRISGLSMDLARSLSAMAVRVVEVIPGKPYVGLELPNMSRETVYLSDVISSDQFQHNKSPTAVVLGQDIAGEAVVADLAKMPHVLVAGTTGSGKSVGVNVMILSILYKATPEEVRFIMIDPKMLELSIYEGIPHLLSEVVTDMKDASNALRWCVGEMERRYKLLSAVGVRNLKGYNDKLKMAAEAGHPIHDPLWQPGDSMDEMPPLLEKLPSIVVIVDEFADLIMVVGKKVEELIARLAQKARAAGIHLVLATQRPSVDVITGLIKANIPARVAFTVSTKTDSRTILDQGGAESLLGMGDMLYLPPGSNHPVRVHGAFASDDDVHAVVNDWKGRGRPVYIDEIVHGEPTAESLLPGEKLEDEEEMDPLYDQVVEFVTDSRRGSVSGVQRRFKIGYNRAARIVEQLEAQGIVSTPGHNGNREVIAPPPVKQFD